MERPETFEDFWPFYLREHARPTTRMLRGELWTEDLAGEEGLVRPLSRRG